MSENILTLLYSVVALAGLGGLFATALLVADRLLANYGSCTIEINGEDQFTIEGGCMLLDALYDNEVFIPSGCGGQGTCGHCKVKVMEGGGPVLPTELPLLTEEEVAASVRLACQIKIKRDLRVEVPEEYFAIQRYRAEVASTHELTPDIRELRLRLIEPERIDFRPGQYVQVEVPDGGDTVHRAYSISSTPDRPDEIELIVKLVPGGVGSAYLHGVREGECITFTGPYGDFVLSEDPDVEVVCVAGGCGVAAAKSIVRYVGNRWPQRRCVLFFGVRGHEDLFYLEEWERLASECAGFEVHVALSEPEGEGEWDGEAGFIHLAVQKHLREGRPRQAFICGPEPMIYATEKVLTEAGVPDADIHCDTW